jgi:hypothetical protein
MKSALAAILALASLLALSACGGASTHEAVSRDMTSTMKDFVATLETVTDKKSAEAAKPKLEAIAKSMQEIQKRMEALGEPTAEQQKELEAKHGKEMEQLMQRMVAASMKLASNPEAMATLQPVLDQMGEGPK